MDISNSCHRSLLFVLDDSVYHQEFIIFFCTPGSLSLGKISAQKTFILGHCLFYTIPRQWRILKINKILFYQFIQFNTLRFHNSTREKGIFLRNASYMTCQHSKKYFFYFLSPHKKGQFLNIYSNTWEHDLRSNDIVIKRSQKTKWYCNSEL